MTVLSSQYRVPVIFTSSQKQVFYMPDIQSEIVLIGEERAFSPCCSDGQNTNLLIFYSGDIKEAIPPFSGQKSVKESINLSPCARAAAVTQSKAPSNLSSYTLSSINKGYFEFML